MSIHYKPHNRIVSGTYANARREQRAEARMRAVWKEILFEYGVALPHIETAQREEIHMSNMRISILREKQPSQAHALTRG